MTDKTIKGPAFAAIILQAIALLIGGICYFAQGSMKALSSIHVDGRVLPDVLITMLIALMLYLIFFLVMLTYEGDSNRSIGVIMTISFCALQLLSTYASRIIAIIDSRKGVEYLAAKSTLSSVISMATMPFTLIATVLALIAVARFGVKEKEVSP